MNEKRLRIYTPKKINMARCIGFAMVDMNGGAWGTLVGTYLMFFLTTFAGLTAGETGIMLATGKILDIFVCMFIGSLSDNLFKTKLGRRFGRRHLLLFAGAFIILVFFPMLFFVVPGAFLYYFIAYFMIDTGNAVIGIAYETLPTEMTPDAQKRVKLSSVRLFVSAFATFSVTALPAILLNYLGEKTASAYTISGIVFGITFAIATLITYFSTWEFSPEYVTEFENKDPKPKTSISETIIDAIAVYGKVLKTRSVRVICTIYFLSYFAKDCYGTAFLYFVVCTLGISQTTGQAVLSLSFIGMIVVPIAGVIMYKTGPRILWSISYTIILCLLLVYGATYTLHIQFDTTSATIFLIILGIFWQIGRQLMEFTPWNVIPLVPDVDTLVSTKLRAGAFAAVQTFTRRATGALGTMLVGFILDWGGYIPKQVEQTQEAKNAILIVFIAIPFILIAICFWMILHFNLNQKTHKIIKTEIDRLKNGGLKTDVDTKTKVITEDLTGYKYSDIWNPEN
ncbi:MAG: MFS transporter [Bifidobacteriaceae bacterium]|jgi:oligogalacturonide transporter|nr:MFS transporter [Bifidobacteriaceae bacterium]